MTDRAVDPQPASLDRHIIDTDGGMVCTVDDVGFAGFQPRSHGASLIE